MLLYVLHFIWDILCAYVTAVVQLIWRPTKKSIHGEIALVTGAGHGMGQLIALKMAKLGATVIVVDINEGNNNETLQMIQDAGGQGHAYTCDLRNLDEIKKLVASIREEVGDVNILVNNAGVIHCRDILSLDDKMISDTFEVNVKSHFFLIKEFLPHMKHRNHGHIVALASIGGYVPNSYMTDYCSSKHAVVGLMDCLRLELKEQGKDGVKTSCICPAFVDTGFVKNPRTKFGRFLFVLTPEYVVDVAMKGVLTDQHLILVPPVSSVLVMLKCICPTNVYFRLLEFIGAEFDLN